MGSVKGIESENQRKALEVRGRVLYDTFSSSPLDVVLHGTSGCRMWSTTPAMTFFVVPLILYSVGGEDGSGDVALRLKDGSKVSLFPNWTLPATR